MGLLDFHSSYKNINCCVFKHDSFSPSADVKPAPNDLMHAMPWQCMFFVES
jgi:hypothetical protein